MDNMMVVRVSKTSKVQKVAGSIAGFIRDGHALCVQAIGGEATYIATRAITLAGQFLAQENVALYFQPEFVYVHDAECQRYLTGLRFKLVTQSLIALGDPDLSVPIQSLADPPGYTMTDHENLF